MRVGLSSDMQCNIPVCELVTKIVLKSLSHCLIVDVTNSHGSRVIVKTRHKSGYIGFCGP